MRFNEVELIHLFMYVYVCMYVCMLFASVLVVPPQWKEVPP